MQARLAGAILERVRDFCAANGAAFVVQNIPKNTPSHELVSEFPSEYVSLDREGAALLDMKPVLDEFKGRELLYWERSHGHWTPFSHRLSGERLAALILEEGLLD